MALPPVPPLNFQSSSSARADTQTALDNSGFVVNIGSGSAGGFPQWAYMVGIVGGVFWLLKRGGKA